MFTENFLWHIPTATERCVDLERYFITNVNPYRTALLDLWLMSVLEPEAYEKSAGFEIEVAMDLIQDDEMRSDLWSKILWESLDINGDDIKIHHRKMYDSIQITINDVPPGTDPKVVALSNQGFVL